MNLQIQELAVDLTAGAFALVGLWFFADALLKLIRYPLSIPTIGSWQKGILLTVPALILGILSAALSDAAVSAYGREGEEFCRNVSSNTLIPHEDAISFKILYKIESPGSADYEIQPTKLMESLLRTGRVVSFGGEKAEDVARALIATRDSQVEPPDDTPDCASFNGVARNLYYVARNTALGNKYRPELSKNQMRIDLPRSIVLWALLFACLHLILVGIGAWAVWGGGLRWAPVEGRAPLLVNGAFVLLYLTIAVTGRHAYVYQSQEYNKQVYGFLATLSAKDLPDLSSTSERQKKTQRAKRREERLARLKGGSSSGTRCARPKHRGSGAPTMGREQAFACAVEDAAIAEQHEQALLNAVVDHNPRLIWKDPDKKLKLRVASWVDQNACDFLSGKLNQHIDADKERWVTLAPEVKKDCAHFGPQPEERLRQKLGLAPNSDYRCFVEYWVGRRDLFRPALDTSIDTAVVDVTRGYNVSDPSSDQAKGSTDIRADLAQLRTVFDSTTRWDDARGVPWTRLGYTYDWGVFTSDSPSEVGYSEYRYFRNAKLKVTSVTPTREYCRREEGNE